MIKSELVSTFLIHYRINYQTSSWSAWVLNGHIILQNNKVIVIAFLNIYLINYYFKMYNSRIIIYDLDFKIKVKDCIEFIFSDLVSESCI